MDKCDICKGKNKENHDCTYCKENNGCPNMFNCYLGDNNYVILEQCKSCDFNHKNN